MPVVVLRTYTSCLAAHAARWRLLEHGIPVGIESGLSGLVSLAFGSESEQTFRLLLGDDRLKPDAELVLEGFDPTADHGLVDAWDEDLEPDLSRLAPEHRPVCPECAIATLDAPTCPACNHTHDLAELVVAQHGPEALEPCYPDPEGVPSDIADLPEQWLVNLALPCESCGANLRGQPAEGACSKCGRAFDKREQLGRISSS